MNIIRNNYFTLILLYLLFSSGLYGTINENEVDTLGYENSGPCFYNCNEWLQIFYKSVVPIGGAINGYQQGDKQFYAYEKYGFASLAGPLTDDRNHLMLGRWIFGANLSYFDYFKILEILSCKFKYLS